MLTFDAFVKKYTGVKCGNTPENTGQCVGLIALWVDNLNLSHIWGDAKDLYNNASDKEWDKFLNSATNIPTKGDILVWNGNSASSVGHTALFLNGTVNDFNSFDQNYPAGSTPHTQYHNYDNLKGWLRPKPQTPPIDPCADLMDQFVVLKSSKDRVVQDLTDLQAKYNTDMQDKNDFIKQLQDTQTNLNTQLLSSVEAIKSAQEANNAAQAIVDTQNTKINDLTARIGVLQAKVDKTAVTKHWWQIWL